jgi:hypothetical protein
MPNLSALRPSPRRPEPRAADGGSAPRVAAAPPTGTPDGHGSAPALPNPAPRPDAALGLVVLEFRHAADGEVRTIPSRREIEACRSAARGGATPGQSSSPPVGSPGRPTPPAPDADPAAART